MHRKRIKSAVMYLLGIRIDPGPKALLLHIVHNVMTSGWSCPAQRQLSVMYQRSERTVKRWIAELVLLGLIEVGRRGRGRTNRYFLSEWLWKRLRSCTPEELGMLTPVKKIQQLTDRSHISHAIRRLAWGARA